ncbi:metalloendoproteinase 5-MMP-like [Nymphaea colorata]|nr:metalloendoproteinase 5-MMP-like [Nymphaea colorata]
MPHHSLGKTWPELRQLSGFGTGHNHSVLPSLKKYLYRLGYLDTVGDIGAFPRVFDEHLQAAIKIYQLFFNLNATGILDSATMHHLIQPRCGVRDIIKPPIWAKIHRNINVIGNSISTLCKLNGARWPASRRNFLYKIWRTADLERKRNNLPYPIEDLRPVFRAAFETWAAVSPFVFVETLLRPDNLHIVFYRGKHVSCPMAFDGRGGSLAHSFDPPIGITHYDADDLWAIDPQKLAETEGSNDLQSVALHELGHLLGLDHSSVPEAVMHPSLKPQTRKVELHDCNHQGSVSRRLIDSQGFDMALYPQGLVILRV